jgi:hypothetical protein
MSIPEELETLFILHEYQWRIDGTLVQPTAADIQDALDRCTEALYDEEPETQVEVGRLIIKKRAANKFDVFVMIGEVHA